METKIEIKSVWGSVLFEFSKEKNTIKDTLIKAVKSWANLSGADLSRADLSEADLSWADLSWADLSRADLSGADLSEADLSWADLSRADLSRADLSRANLSGANLSGADLSRADLLEANISGADLSEANLSEANLSGADLSEADLKKIVAYTSLLPEGEIIVWKKLKDNLICQLLIPKDAKRINGISSRKCRFEYAKVIAIYDSKKKVKRGYGQHVADFLYEVGKIVRPDSFNDDPREVCSNGIHAFITRLEAEKY